MAIVLALTAGGIILAYLLLHVGPVDGQDDERGARRALRGRLDLGGLPARALVRRGSRLVSEALLLFVAAQAGFIDGPRVMANMARGLAGCRTASRSCRTG